MFVAMGGGGLTCAEGLSTPAARCIVYAPSLPGRNGFCGRDTRGSPGGKGTGFRHGGETPAVIRPAPYCRRTQMICRPDPPLLARGVEA
jgi:hypothetical protein